MNKKVDLLLNCAGCNRPLTGKVFQKMIPDGNDNHKLIGFCSDECYQKNKVVLENQMRLTLKSEGTSSSSKGTLH